MIFNSQISGGGDGDGALVVTLSWDEDYFDEGEGAWVPDKTYAEIAAAYSAGREIVIQTDIDPYDVSADGIWSVDDSALFYDVRSYNNGQDERTYWLKSTGVELSESNHYVEPPSGTVNIAQAGDTDVTSYATAHVPAGGIADDGITGEFVTQNNARKWRVMGWLDLTAGWYSAGVQSTPWTIYNAIASNTSVTPTESAQTIGGTRYMMEGAVTVNAISSTYVGSGITRRSSSDLTANGLTVNAPSGYYQSAASKTLTDQNLIASNIKKNISIFGVTGNYEGEGGGGGSGLQIATASKTPSSASTSIQFTDLIGEPTSFYLIAKDNLATGSPAKAAAVIFDGTDLHGQDVTNTSNAQASYDSNYTKSYSNGTLTIQGSAYFQAIEYVLIYTVGGSSANIGTSDIQVGSGATSITFPNIPEEPTCWGVVFKSNFSTSSGYTRTMAVVNDGTGIYGLEMGSGAQATEHWSASYSNGSLVISSDSTSQGGYFHQPGYYELVYAIGGEIEIEIESLSVTENGTYQESGKAYSPVVVNVPSGGGSVNIDTKTVTASNRPTSLSFSSMKGQPKAFVLRCTSSMSRSSSSTYYYVAMMRYDGTSTTGNCWRMSNGNWTNIASGYSFTYSNGTLTVTSSGTTTTSPGCFYPGNYELVYIY